MFGNVADYSYLNAKVHAKKSKFLSAKDYERLYNASTSEDLYRLISTTNFASTDLNNLLLSGDVYSATDIDSIMIRDFQTNFAILSQQLPMHTVNFVRAFEKRFFVEALKLIIKAKHFEMEDDQISKLVVLPSAKYQKIADQLIKLQSVNNVIEQIPFPEYKKALQDAMPDYEQANSPLILEMAVFQVFYRKLWAASYTLNLQDRNGVFAIVGTEIDLTNVLAIIRAKKLNMDTELIKKWLISKNYLLSQQTVDNIRQVTNLNQIEPLLASVNSYKELSMQIRELFEGNDVSIDRLERKFKEFLVQRAVRSLSGNPFHLGIFFGYVHLAQVEFANVRAIIIGKMADLPSDEIKNAIFYF